jgi:prepilin-type N-terminal cleavage/methylation domain-containing protein
MSKGEKGYTLLEMIMVTAIISILASVAIPKYAETLKKSQEGALRGNLGALRSALQIYYGDNQGVSPTCTLGPASTVFTTSLVPAYIQKVPSVRSGLHLPNTSVYCDADMVAGSVHDGQGWYYDGTIPEDINRGKVWVACDHTDSKGSDWTRY